MPLPVETRIENLDLSLFALESQTSNDDRRSLLAVQKAVRSWRPGYAYLECGSHMGGSLVPHLIDPSCRSVISVDKRPAFQLDERGIVCPYPENLTQRMIAALARLVPPEGMAKLATWDLDASSLTRSQVPNPPDLVLIDAEHTSEAVFRDFTSLLPLCGPSTVWAFHDANIVTSAILNIETLLRYLKIEFASVFLRECVFVLGTGEARAVVQTLGGAFAIERQKFILESQLGLMRAHHDAWASDNPRPAVKPRAENRNAPCPCGSGKRYKHCHGR